MKAAAPAVLSWSLHNDPPLPAARNMALDHALAEMVEPGRAALRLYEWAHPTVSFGRNEPARARWGGGAGAPHSLHFVRRPTGGRAVLHDRELTYAIVLPVRALGGPRALYRRVNEALVAGLRTLGADVTVSDGGLTLAPDAGPCFQVPAPGEVVSRGRKLVGSAQARLDGALLQHGSILLSGDQRLLDESGADDGAITLGELVGLLPVGEVRAAVEEGFRRVLGGAWTEAAREAELAERADRLERERYTCDTWTWRR